MIKAAYGILYAAFSYSLFKIWPDSPRDPARKFFEIFVDMDCLFIVFNEDYSNNKNYSLFMFLYINLHILPVPLNDGVPLKEYAENRFQQAVTPKIQIGLGAVSTSTVFVPLL
jgi:hypothetical protein